MNDDSLIVGNEQQLLDQLWSPTERRFGTLISGNSPKNVPGKTIRKVKVIRRTPLSTSRRTPPTKSREYTVSFPPGPIGLQVEPDDVNICRVQAFIDQSDGEAGAAEKCNLIQIGDCVVKINDTSVYDYSSAVAQLQNRTVWREITFQRLGKSESSLRLGRSRTDTNVKAPFIPEDEPFNADITDHSFHHDRSDTKSVLPGNLHKLPKPWIGSPNSIGNISKDGSDISALFSPDESVKSQSYSKTTIASSFVKPRELEKDLSHQDGGMNETDADSNHNTTIDMPHTPHSSSIDSEIDYKSIMAALQLTNKELCQQLKQTEEELTETKENYNSATDELNKWLTSVQDTQQIQLINHNLSEQLRRTRDDLLETKQLCKHLDETVHEKEREVADATSQIDLKQQEIDNLNNTISLEQENVNSAQAEALQYKTRLDEISVALNKSVTKVQELQECQKSEQKEKDDLLNRIQQFEDESEKNRAIVDNLQVRNEHLESELCTKQSTCDQMKQKIAQLEQEKETDKHTLTDLETRLHEREVDLNKKSDQNDQLTKQVEALASKLRDETTLSDQLSRELELTSENLASVTLDRDDKSNENLSQQKLYNKVCEENKVLNKQLDDFMLQVKTLENKVNERDNSISQTNNELSLFRKEKQVGAEKIAEMKLENKSLHKIISQVKSELALAKEEVQSSMSTNLALKFDNDSLHDDLHQTKNELSLFREENQSNVAKSASLKLENESLRDETEKVNLLISSQRDAHKKELYIYNENIRLKESNIQAYRVALDQTKEALSKAQQKNAELNTKLTLLVKQSTEQTGLYTTILTNLPEIVLGDDDCDITSRLQGMGLDEGDVMLNTYNNVCSSLKKVLVEARQAENSLQIKLSQQEKEMLDRNQRIHTLESELQDQSSRLETIQKRLALTEEEYDKQSADDYDTIVQLQAEVDKKESEINEAFLTLQESHERCDRLNSELEWTTQKLKSAESLNVELQEYNERIVAEKESLKLQFESDLHSVVTGEKSKLKILLQEYKNKLVKLQDENVSLIQSVDNLRDALLSANKNKEDLSIQLEATCEKLDTTSEQLSNRTIDYVRSMGEVDACRTEIKNLAKALETSQSSLSKANKDMTRLKDEYEKSSKLKANEQAELEKKVLDLEESLDKELAKSNESKHLVTALRHQVSESEADVSFKGEEIQRLLMIIAELKQSHNAVSSDMENKLRRALDDIEGYRECTEMLEERGAQLEIDIFEHEAAAVGQVEIIQGLQNKISEYAEANSILKTSLNAAADRTENLQHDLATLKQQLQKSEAVRCKDRDLILRKTLHGQILSIYIAILESKQAASDQICQEYQAQVDTLSSKITACQADLDELRTANATIRSSMDDIKLQTDLKVNSVLETSKVEHNRLSALLEESQTNVQKYATLARNVKNQLRECERELSEAKGQIETLTKSNDDLSHALDSVENKLIESIVPANESIDDSHIDEFSSMTRSELKIRSRELTEQNDKEHERAMTAVTNIAKKVNYIKRLEADIDSLREELAHLVKSNEDLSARLQTVSDEETTLKSRTATLEIALRMKETEVHDLTASLKDLEIQKKSTVDTLQQQIEDLLVHEKKNNDVVAELIQEANVVKQKMNEKDEKLKIMSSEYNNCRLQLSDALTASDILATKLKGCEASYEVMKHDNKQLRDQVEYLSQARHDISTSVLELEQRNEQLQKMLDKRATDVASTLSQLQQSKESAKQAMETVQSITNKLHGAEETIAEKDAELKTIYECHNDNIRRMNELSETVESLRTANENLEGLLDKDSEHLKQQLQQVEERCQSISSNRDSLRTEVTELRTAVKVLRHDCATLKEQNKRLETKLSAQKSANEKLRAGKDALNNDLEQCEMTIMRLEGEVEAKAVELQAIVSKEQILESTISRLKAERHTAAVSLDSQKVTEHATNSNARCQGCSDMQLILKQKARDTDVMDRKNKSLDGECSKARDNIATMTRSIMSVLNTLEILSQSLKVGFTKHNLNSNNVGQCIESGLQATVMNGVNDIKLKLERLIEAVSGYNGMAMHANIGQSTYTTVQTTTNHDINGKSSNSMASPSVKDALQQVKRVLHEELMSPIKGRDRRDDDSEDMNLCDVVNALENQIDSLLDDLQSANESLKMKDQLFSDLEQAVVNHEKERERLRSLLQASEEKQHAQSNENMTDNTNGERIISNENKDDKSVCAVKLLLRVSASRQQATKANAFRLWYRQALVASTLARHRQVSEELFRELDATRAKLSILKNHLKKSRRYQNTGLERILEGFESA